MKLIIPGRLPGLNEYTKANRSSCMAGAQMKKEYEEVIGWEIVKQLKRKRFTSVRLTFSWYERDKKRDKDNIAFAKKFVLDAMQKTGTLTGDGWGQVIGFSDEFYVDKERPRVEVEIEIVEAG